MNSLIDKDRYKAIIFLVLTAILWSIGGLLIKIINWNPIAIAGTRSSIAALLMLFVLRKPKITFSKPQVGGAIAYALTVICFVAANKLTTAANAILLQYTAPIYTALFSTWLLKEKITRIDWITIFAVIFGMLLFFIDNVSSGSFIGNIIAIISGISFSLVAIFMRMQKDGSTMETPFLGNILTAIIAIPFIFLSPKIDIKSFFALLILGIFQLGLSYILYSYAIKHVSALEAILIPIIEPILNPIWVFLIMGEIPGFYAIIGGIIVVFFITFRCIIFEVKYKKIKNL